MVSRTSKRNKTNAGKSGQAPEADPFVVHTHTREKFQKILGPSPSTDQGIDWKGASLRRQLSEVSLRVEVHLRTRQTHLADRGDMMNKTAPDESLSETG